MTKPSQYKPWYKEGDLVWVHSPRGIIQVEILADYGVDILVKDYWVGKKDNDSWVEDVYPTKQEAEEALK